jgi:hypothetical protein
MELNFEIFDSVSVYITETPMVSVAVEVDHLCTIDDATPTILSRQDYTSHRYSNNA